MPRSVAMTKSARARLREFGHLPLQNPLEHGFGHARSRQHPVALDLGGGRHHQNAIEPALGAGLVEERNIEDHHVRAGVRGGEGLAVRRDEGMNARLDPGEEVGIGDDGVAQAVTVDRAGGDSLRREPGHGGGAGAAGGVEPVNRRIGVPDGNAGVGEEPGGGGFAHAHGSGQPEAVGARPDHSASTAARSSASTTGGTPNQLSKPGAAWCSSIPSPSTAVSPRCRAAVTNGVGSPP